MNQQTAPSPAPSLPPSPPPQVGIALLATTLVLAFSSLVALFPSAIAPTLADSLGVSTATVGIQVSLIFGGAMLTSLVGGPLTRRYGPCRVSQLALGLLGGGAALLTLPSLATFALASLIAGLGYGLTNPSASLLLFRVTPRHRQGLVFSLKQTGVPLGGVLAGLVAPALALAIGWQAALGCLFLVAVIGILLLQVQRHHWDRERDPRTPWLTTPLAGLQVVWQRPALRYLALLSLCFSAIQLSVSAFTVALLVEDLGVGLVVAGATMSAVQVFGIIGRVLWGLVGDILDDRLITLMGLACLSAGSGLAIATMDADWPRWTMVAVLCLMSLSALGWNGVFMAEITRLAPAERVADAAGGCLVLTYSGVLVGLPLLGALHGLFGSYTALFGLLAGLALVGLGFLLKARRAIAAPG
ncbi:MFS transporter [Halomonas litopenaei]|uniref:MFS transporter n=1 Tax=Halomonas litopenaei TaxID=2109328 RepID=A0ABX5IX69_9GAMM|nr:MULTISPECIES: MFS transporter [Halomonas]PTL92243.1 MFS transporter [Halomonas sp. SYSU XM8]PTL94704.1 MFS transporter [Halomonas litopenaei]